VFRRWPPEAAIATRRCRRPSAEDPWPVSGHKQGLRAGKDADARTGDHLDRPPARRGSGSEGKNPAHPFTDVLAWASPYVGYGYQNALVKGVSETLFGYGKLVTEAQFLTMVLRLLQYEDDTDFTWNKSAELAEKLGLPVVPADSGEYTRGNAVDVIWALLETKFKSGGKTLAQTLIEKACLRKRLTEKRWERIAPISARFFPF